MFGKGHYVHATAVGYTEWHVKTFGDKPQVPFLGSTPGITLFCIKRLMSRKKNWEFKVGLV